MTLEFQTSLKKLLIDPKDSFHRQVRERIGKKATESFEGRLKEFVLRMPIVISRIEQIAQTEKPGSTARRLADQMLTYLKDPADFLPEQTEGLFGYVDDVYFASVVYLSILGNLSPSHRTAEDRKNKEWIASGLALVRYVIPREAEKIDRVVSGIVEAKEQGSIGS